MSAPLLHSTLQPRGTPLLKSVAAKMRRARKRLHVVIKAGAKDGAKFRDDYRCRRCGTPHEQAFGGVEAAHIEDAGMGGRLSVSNTPACYVTLCHTPCHQGPRSVHSGHIQIVPRTDRGGDGPVDFVDVERPGTRRKSRVFLNAS